MNGKDIFLGLKYVDDDLIEEAEFGTFPANRESVFRRPFLLAAMIALMLLLVGCAVVYVMHMQDLKVGEQELSYDAFDPDTLEYLGKETYTEQVFTVAGLQGTPAYQAAQEWFDFKQSYDPDWEILDSVWGNEPEFPAEYGSYNIYTQEMKEKVDEICKKYGLKLAGAVLEFRTLQNMCEALEIEKFQTAQNDLTIRVDSGGCRENGNFGLNMHITFPEDAQSELTDSWAVLDWNRKDCFTTEVITFEDTGDWKEWNYTTSSGNEVLITRSPSDWRGYIICNREEAILSLQIEVRRDLGNNVDGKTWWEHVYMTDRQMEQIADAIDFGIQPRIATREDVQNQPAASNAATQNGYTVELKSVETDGWKARITVGITAPGGAVISRNPHEGFEDTPYYLGCANFDSFTPAAGKEISTNGGWNIQEDHDGLDNTQDLILETFVEMEDGSAPFGAGTVWNIHFEDMEGSYWDDEKHVMVTELLAEGEWNFQVVFDNTNGDFREIEFLKEPLIMKAITGFKADGTDVFGDVEVTSFTLYAMSAAIRHHYDAAVDFSRYDMPMYAVMKDGSRVGLQPTGSSTGVTWYDLETDIDVDQVDHVILMDGTRLETPQ